MAAAELIATRVSDITDRALPDDMVAGYYAGTKK
jgi:hypothetical protein